jgi:hypothetical protein
LEMNGGQVLASVGGQVVSNAWTIVGTGDFKAATRLTSFGAIRTGPW